MVKSKLFGIASSVAPRKPRPHRSIAIYQTRELVDDLAQDTIIISKLQNDSKKLRPVIMNEPTPLTAPPSAPAREPITCHVLDLTTGRPASSVSVSLNLLRPLGPSAPLTAVTSSDGRINHWSGEAGSSLSQIFANLAEHDDGEMLWSLKFDTGAYFGESKTFFPEVEVKFFVNAKDGHYHVPLLLGPWSYTTYRGS
ncbi:MAG: hypothetical protein Q9196_002711 [Gyalolechia fulgens]